MVSANLTPLAETAIGQRSEEVLEKKLYDDRAYTENGCPQLPRPQAFTMMPWLRFSPKTPDDPGAIYTHLRSRAPVRNTEWRPVPEHPT